MEFRAPTPTDYAGVRFRSKSEAIFARAMDLASERNKKRVTLEWEYEPMPDYWDDKFRPWSPIFYGCDFGVVIEQDGADMRAGVMAIEYKPSMPAGAYLELWQDRSDEIRLSRGVLCMLCYGSPWNGEYGSICDRDQLTEGWPLRMEEYAQEAKAYRFDLAA